MAALHSSELPGVSLLDTKDSVQCLSIDEMRGPAEFMRKTSNYVMDYGRSYSIMGDLLAYS